MPTVFLCYNYFMAKTNYQLLTDKCLEQLKNSSETPSLLLHCCCAPCASYCLEYLTKYFSVSVFFYNPNIFPYEEYEKRRDELKRLIKEMPLSRNVKFVESRFDSNDFFSVAKGLEDAVEGGARCKECFNLRLEKTAQTAKQSGFDYFCSTLTISPLKDEQLINQIGQKIEKETGVKWLSSDFKKRGGYLRSILLSKQYGLYRQNYCGCLFSKPKDNQI
jgi:predicted adenine nucleotide alpha hydrolase (AANH) superfamily ATPase